MTRRARCLPGALAAAVLLASCGYDSVAGKTTTTSNGGGGVVAVGPDGRPLPGCIAYAARSWDPVSGQPGIVDTLRGDSTGTIDLSRDAYAFVEIQNGQRTLGAWARRVDVRAGDARTIQLDSLSRLQGRWADRSSIAAAGLFLDSTLRSASLQDDGSFAFEMLPAGDYALMLRPATGAARPMGAARVGRGTVRYTGSGNIVLAGDTSGSPLWIDDFESGGIWPMLRPSYPGISPWFVWAVQADLLLPGSTEPDSIPRAIGSDSSRPGKAFHARFTPTGSYAQVAVGITNLEIDLRSRSQVCFSYRTDAPVLVEFQRDSVSGLRPTFSATLPAQTRWLDTCAPIAGFAATSETPDSLASWNAFGRRVLALQFRTSNTATYLDLDDVRLR